MLKLLPIACFISSYASLFKLDKQSYASFPIPDGSCLARLLLKSFSPLLKANGLEPVESLPDGKILVLEAVAGVSFLSWVICDF